MRSHLQRWSVILLPLLALAFAGPVLGSVPKAVFLESFTSTG